MLEVGTMTGVSGEAEAEEDNSLLLEKSPKANREKKKFPFVSLSSALRHPVSASHWPNPAGNQQKQELGKHHLEMIESRACVLNCYKIVPPLCKPMSITSI